MSDDEVGTKYCTYTGKACKTPVDCDVNGGCIQRKERIVVTDRCIHCDRSGREGHAPDCPSRWAAKEAKRERTRPEYGADLMAGEPPDAEHFLQRLLDIRRERGEAYGTHYRRAGDLLFQLFPSGLELRTPEDFGRIHHVVFMMDKLHRYCQHFGRGGHPDSLDDLAVYAMLCRDVDARRKP